MNLSHFLKKAIFFSFLSIQALSLSAAVRHSSFDMKALEAELDDEFSPQKPQIKWRPNNIIIITGTSSCGKTTEASKIQHYLNCEIVTMDKLTEKKLSQSWDSHKQSMKQPMKTFTPPLSSKKPHGWNTCHLATFDALTQYSNQTIICDIVLINDGRQDLTKDFVTKLKQQGHHVYIELVYSPLDTLIAHLLARNTSINPQDHRNFWKALIDYFETFFDPARAKKEQPIRALPLFASPESTIDDVLSQITKLPCTKEEEPLKAAVIEKLTHIKQTERFPEVYYPYDFYYINTGKTSETFATLCTELDEWLGKFENQETSDNDDEDNEPDDGTNDDSDSKNQAQDPDDCPFEFGDGDDKKD